MQPVSNSAALWQRPTAGQETSLCVKVQNVSLCGSEGLWDGETATERKMRVKEAREGVQGGLEVCVKERQQENEENKR